MKKLFLILFVFASFCISLFSQSPQSFSYQAVVRDAVGDVIVNQNVSLRINILKTSSSGTSVYAESHSVTTNQFGLVNIIIGSGTPISGNFTNIDWGNDQYFIKLELDPNGGSSYQFMGSTQLLSVPYALYSKSAGNGTLWSENNNDIYFNTGNVGIGAITPNGKLLVQSDPTAGVNDDIFSVLNANGDTVFAVYQEGVRIYVDDNGGTKANGNRGGFAVGGFSPTKAGFTNEYLRVTPDSVRVYIDDDFVSTKANGSRGGFAVGGFSPTKGFITDDYLFVQDDSTRVWTNGPAGFEIRDLATSSNNYLDLNPDNCFIGLNTGFSNNAGMYNVMLGNLSGYSNNNGSYNVFLGNNTGGANTDGNDNIFIGNFTGQNNITGEDNIFMGTLTGNMNVSGLRNIFIGSGAGSNSVANDNIFIGDECASSNTSGWSNVCIGNSSSYSLNTGAFNTIIGTNAGSGNIAGSYNVFLGFYAGGNETGSEKLYIENSNAASSSALIYGEFDNDILVFNGSVGVNTLTPDNSFDVNGKISLTQSAGDEMVIINDNQWQHSSGIQDFGVGGDYFIMASAEGSVESAGIYGDGDYVTIWSAGDANRIIRFLDEDMFDGGDTDPYNNGAEKAYIDASGQYFQVSDKDKKQDLNLLQNPLDKIRSINGYTYNYILCENEITKGQKPTNACGVLAQEIEQVLPEAVQTNTSGEKFVNYSSIIPLLIEGMKEQQRTIDQLESEKEDLVNRIEKIEEMFK